MEKTVLRNRSIGTKVSEEEYAALEKLAASRGLTLGEWFREVVLGELVAQPAEQVILAEVLGLRHGDKDGRRCSLRHFRNVRARTAKSPTLIEPTLDFSLLFGGPAQSATMVIQVKQGLHAIFTEAYSRKPHDAGRRRESLVKRRPIAATSFEKRLQLR